METLTDVRIPWQGWQMVQLIGHGGFGSVYEIRRMQYGITESAAMKVVNIPRDPSAIAADMSDGYDMESIRLKYQDCLTEILNEYKLMYRLRGHSNIVDCEDIHCEEHVGEIGWTLYIRMELLHPLKERLSHGNLTEAEVVSLGKDICRALVTCADNQIIHRDVKPENIMISQFGYKLGDFGVARTLDHTTNATVTGTERYMAPEVMRGMKYGPDVDTYSLGLVMYWLLNNRRMPFWPQGNIPLKSSEVQAAQQRRMFGEPLPAPVNGSEELKRIVLKACAFDRNARYLTARKMLADLEALPVAAPEVPPQSAQSQSTPQVAQPQSGPWGAPRQNAFTAVQQNAIPDEADEDDETVGIWGSTPNAANQVYFCTNCGARFDKPMNICTTCGQKIIRNTRTAQPQVQHQPQFQAQPQPQAQPRPQPVVQPQAQAWSQPQTQAQSQVRLQPQVQPQPQVQRQANSGRQSAATSVSAAGKKMSPLELITLILLGCAAMVNFYYFFSTLSLVRVTGTWSGYNVTDVLFSIVAVGGCALGIFSVLKSEKFGRALAWLPVVIFEVSSINYVQFFSYFTKGMGSSTWYLINLYFWIPLAAIIVILAYSMRDKLGRITAWLIPLVLIALHAFFRTIWYITLITTYAGSGLPAGMGNYVFSIFLILIQFSAFCVYVFMLGRRNRNR